MAHAALPDQFEFVAVTTDTLLGVAMPDTVAGAGGSLGGNVGVVELGGETPVVLLPEPPLHALISVTSVTAQRPEPNLRLSIIECSHVKLEGMPRGTRMTW